MRTIAIIGAGGFVGSRMVEMFHLGEFAQVRPVVRKFQSLARLSRFELDFRVADALDFHALKIAFDGCDAVINTAVGDERVIEGIIEPVWRACLAAKVRRLIYLSSGSVHGQTPDDGTTENTPLSSKQWNWYNNAKVRAEQMLATFSADSPLELVVLRPTIVFGPRSRWVWDAAKSIASGRACLVNDGRGICNSIYVDNLVHAVKLAIDSPAAAGETFLVNDEETVTWRDFYEPLAARLGKRDISSISPQPPPEKHFNLVEAVRAIPGIQKALPVVPDPMKRAVKGAWEKMSEPARPSPWRLPKKAAPSLSPEMNALQQCSWRLPHTKAAEMLGYRAPVSFAEGMRRSIAWLEFARFPNLPK